LKGPNRAPASESYIYEFNIDIKGCELLRQ